jgi:hypothetical protein
MYVGDTEYLERYLLSKGVKSFAQYKQTFSKLQEPAEQICK